MCVTNVVKLLVSLSETTPKVVMIVNISIINSRSSFPSKEFMKEFGGYRCYGQIEGCYCDSVWSPASLKHHSLLQGFWRL